jgi:flagella basal body P-ring formation protein FlgA
MNQAHLRMFLAASLFLPVAAACSQTPGDANAPTNVWLQIHLPREVTVAQSALDLSQIAVIRGSPQWVNVAGGVGLGRISLPGQRLVVDRSTILSRLAASGIPADKVLLTGADTVTIRNNQKTIGAEEFVIVARQLLQDTFSNRSVIEMTAAVKPKELALAAEPQRVQLEPRVIRADARGLVTVQVRVMADGRDVGTRDIPFRLKFEVRQAIAAKDIPQGMPLSADNIRIEKRTSEQPEPANWQPPYGRVALRALAADQEIRADMVEAPQPAVLVRRNEAVTIRIQRPGLLITAMGLALQEGRAGEPVKVRNIDSSRIIVCKVNTDGTVEPVL